MRSSFNTATITKRVALAAIASSMICLSGQVVIAQGDASLPPPDPSYRLKTKQGANRNPDAPLFEPSQLAPFSGTPGGDSPDDSLRAKWRKRLNGGDGAGLKGTGLDNTGAGIGGGRFGGRMGLRQGDGTGTGAAFGGARRQGDGSAGLGGGALGAGGRRGFQNALVGAGNMFGRRPLDLTSLALSAEQKQKIQTMREQLGPKTRELRKTLNAKRMELRDVMFEASAGDDQVRAKRKEVRQLQDKIEDMQINDFLSIRSVLTPDQRQKLTDLKPAGTKFAAGNGAGNGGPTQFVAPVVTSP